MGFRVKVLPGVRVRVSSRGVRTSIGPRIARVHVGGGRTGFSTGIGPISYGTSLGGGSSSRRSSSGSYGSTYGPTPTQSAKLDEARQIEARLNRLTKAHLERFAPAEREIAYPKAVEPLGVFAFRFRKQEKAGISFFKFEERRQAQARAIQLAAKAHQEAIEREMTVVEERQVQMDEHWAKLISNDPETVITAMTDAFGDNEARSAALNVEGDNATVVVVIPDISVLPARDWSITPAGNLSVKRMTAASRDGYYFDLVFSQLVATANEGFAVAPGINRLRVVLVRNKAAKQLNKIQLDCLGYGDVFREKLATADEPFPFGLLQASSDGWMNNIDHNLRFKPMDLGHEPEIRKLLDSLSDD